MEPFVYRTIHLYGGRVRLLDEQLTLLERAAAELFGVRYRPDRAAAAERLLAAARRERYPAGVSGFVRIEVTASGEERLRPCGTSLYAGYALRSLRPEAVTLRYDRLFAYDRPFAGGGCGERPFAGAPGPGCGRPFGEAPREDRPFAEEPGPDCLLGEGPRYDCLFAEAPTSASEAEDALARAVARRLGADEAVRCDAAGVCRSLGDAPLFAVRDGVLYGDRSGAARFSAEAEPLWRAAAAERVRTVDRPLLREEMGRFDELFAVDHRGITALARCDGHPYMAIVAERLTKALEAAARERR